MFSGQKPSRCPCGLEDGGDCLVVVKAYRVRKTGPEFKLLVAKCKIHKNCFTVYPPGYTPYSRDKWVPVVESGHAIIDDGKEASGELSSFEATIFSSAIDAERREKWPATLSPSERKTKELPQGVFQTQKRQIKLFSQFFGLEPAGSEKLQQAIASVLDIPALRLRDYASAIRAGPTYRSRAGGIKKILQNLQNKPGLMMKIYDLGKLLGFWGSAYIWTPPLSITATLESVP